MAASEAQKRATAKYLKEKTKRIETRFFPSEMDLFEYVKSKESAAGFIKDLIREAMEREKG